MKLPVITYNRSTTGLPHLLKQHCRSAVFVAAAVLPAGLSPATMGSASHQLRSLPADHLVRLWPGLTCCALGVCSLQSDYSTSSGMLTSVFTLLMYCVQTVLHVLAGLVCHPHTYKTHEAGIPVGSYCAYQKCHDFVYMMCHQPFTVHVRPAVILVATVAAAAAATSTWLQRRL
jgi:hypothetical protein